MHGPEAQHPSGWWRLAAPSVAIPIVVGSVALVLHREAPALAAASPCPGLLEAAFIIGARARRSSEIGPWLIASWGAALVLAVAAVTWVGRRVTGGWRAASATALTLGLLPLFARALAPPDAVAVALSAAWLAMVLSSQPLDRFRPHPLALSAILVLAACVVPPLAIPLAGVAIVAGLERRGESGAISTAVMTVALTIGLPVVLGAVMPSLPPDASGPSASCVLTTAGLTAPGRTWQAVRDVVVGPSGIYAVVLAALGAFTLRRAIASTAARTVLCFVLLPLVVAGAPVGPTTRLLAPTLVGWWALVAVGLSTVVRTCARGPGGRVAALLLLALLPGLQLLQPEAPLAIEQVPLGHETLSASSVARILDAAPDGSVLVREDAVTDMLLRSADGRWQRVGKSVRTVDRASDRLVELALAPGVVYALPGAQADLQNLGFQLAEAPAPQEPGVSLVRTGGTCVPLGSDWRDVSGVATSGFVALASDSDDPAGPVEMYAAGPPSLAPRSVGVPVAETFGVAHTDFDIGTADSATRLQQDLDARGASARAELMRSPRVVLVEIWRRDGAPRRAALELGGVPATAIARVTDGNRSLALCPAFPYDRRALRTSRR